MVGFVILIILFILAIIVATAIFGSSSFAEGVTAFLISTAIAGYFAISIGLTTFAEERVVTCTVTSKDRGGGDSGSYRIYTSDCGVLANGDNPLLFKFNSADIWAEIPDEGPVTVHLVGVRNGLFSWFPNVIEVVESQ